ncbi:hypothetical protein BG841_03955 [Marinobacter sp. X15-166B]|nr:hypothetical protein BG841_03955 [Marinobacter sp. X15-166B]
MPAATPGDTRPLVSPYDSRLFNTRTLAPLTVAQLAAELASADVVIVGEIHGHQGSHLLQARLQGSLHRIRPAQVLSMEQFNLDHQAALDEYLAGDTGEMELREDAHAWPNYPGSYRPLIEYARYHRLPVIAANAPAHTVRCVGRQGASYLDRLPESARQALPAAPFYGTAPYQRKFFAHMEQHGPADGRSHNEGRRDRLHNSYLAQLLRDNTMAERILHALAAHPEGQVLHTTGTFHSEAYLGTVAALRARQPDLRVSVISPIQVTPGEPIHLSAEHRAQGDYVYFITTLPEAYLDPVRRQKSWQQQFAKAAARPCDRSAPAE